LLLRKETLKSNAKKRRDERERERERSGDKGEGERTRHQSRRREGHRKQTKLLAEVEEEGRKKERKEGKEE
jgi:hypothetical protein